ncbi:MAG: TIM barrel protein [Chloroflexota bacterium]|nr:TIM barrel protein [Chloroflexota bacterium]
MRIQYFCSLWGMAQPTLTANLQLIKEAGFDGVEMAAPTDAAQRRELRTQLDDLALEIIVQQHSRGSTPQEHAQSLAELLAHGAELRPLWINSHTGKDFFPIKESVRIIKQTSKIAAGLGLPIVHEIHRTRALFSLPAILALLDALPDLKLTADLSHLCVVHESMLQDQADSLQRALHRTYHIHARVGYPEGPQVPDPRAPEWQAAVDTHIGWWQQIVNHRQQEGLESLTIATEFGPPHYLATLPYTRQPVANLWEINLYMRDLLKQRLNNNG